MSRSRALAATLIAALFPGLAAGDVVFDGTLGPTGSLSGAIDISDSYGTQVGPNLFHSFASFNINTGESVNFSSAFAGVTDKVIGRVTGGELSTIDGLLSSSIAGADLWLINPNGVVFGANASLDLQGGLHVTSADYLLMEDGGRFDATAPENSLLSMAHPSAFGFVDAVPGDLSVGGASLILPAGGDLSLIGGDVSVSDSVIRVPGGDVTLLGTAGSVETSLSEPDAASLSGAVTLTAGDVNSAADSAGDILVIGGELVMSTDSFLIANTGGTEPTDRGGDISLIGDKLTLESGSQIASSTLFAGAGGSVHIDVADLVTIQGTGPAMGAPSGLFANVRNTSTGDGGDVSIAAREVHILEGGLITALTQGSGNAGTIEITADERVLIRNSGDGFFGAIFANAIDLGDGLATGSPGDVAITAPEVELADNARIQATTRIGTGGSITIDADGLAVRDGSQITASTYGPGDAGSVILNVAGTVSVAGTDSNGFPSGIFTSVVFPADGAGGDIVVNARVLELQDGGQFVGSAGFLGEGGSIVVNASERVSLTGGVAPLFTGIFNNAYSVGNAGTIEIVTPLLDMGPGSFLQSVSFLTQFGPALGNAGDITLNVDNLNVNGGYIQSRTEAAGSGGHITINAADTITLANPPGFAHGGGFDLERAGIFINTSSSAPGGAVTIHTGDLILLDGGFIDAATFHGDGPGGSILITAAGAVSIAAVGNPDTAISSNSSGLGAAGSIEIQASAISITGLGTLQAAALGDGAGGRILLLADRLAVSDGGSIKAVATASGFAGNIALIVDGELLLDGGSIETSAQNSAGGNVDLEIGDRLLMVHGRISAEAGGVTPGDDGGNVTIDPVFVILSESEILASANAGNGGNIEIVADSFVIDTTSTIDASSQTGLDGEIVIDSPNEITGTVIQVDPPALGVDEVLTRRCVPQLQSQRSTLTVDAAGGTGQSAGDLLASPAAIESSSRRAVARRAPSSDTAPTPVLAAVYADGSCFSGASP